MMPEALATILQPTSEAEHRNQQAKENGIEKQSADDIVDTLKDLDRE